MMTYSPCIVFRAVLLVANEIAHLRRGCTLDRPLAVAHTDGAQVGPLLGMSNPFPCMDDVVAAIFLTSVSLLARRIRVVMQSRVVAVDGLLEHLLDVFQ